MRLIGALTAGLLFGVTGAYSADRVENAFQDSVMAPQIAGFVEASVGYDWWSDEGFSGDATVASLRGTIAAPIADNFGVQLDLDGEAWWWGADMGIPSGDARQGAATAHLFYRNPARGALGVVGGVWAVDSSARADTFSGGVIGVEGQLYAGNATVYGQAGYGHFDYPVSTPGPFAMPDETDALFAVAGARVFATENTVVDGKVSFTHNNSMIMDYNVFRARARAEHRFANTPFSVFTSYEYTTWSHFDGDEQVVRGGLRAYLGPDTLIYNDRYGASQESLFDLMAWN